MDLSKIREKCANIVFLHSKSCQKFCQTAAWPPFLWSEFRKCDLSYESEEVFFIYSMIEILTSEVEVPNNLIIAIINHGLDRELKKNLEIL